MHHLNYTDSFMLQKKTKGGITPTQLKALDKKASAAFSELEILAETGEQGFFTLPYADIKAIRKHAEEVKKHFRGMIVIGIGGSDLGARTIKQALYEEGKGVWVDFLGNPDPETLHGYIHGGACWKDVALCVVSKSGKTLETMSIFMTMKKALEKEVGKSKAKKHIYFITDPKPESLLYQLAHKEGYAMIPHPLNVGGRFSVLSAVGLFPAACMGIDIKKMLKGAAEVYEEHLSKKEKSSVAKFAKHHYHAMKKGKDLHICMPYADRLQSFSIWFRQIWAESLGKEGKGPTPIAALGATDQHSQIQLYNDGPNNKVITFLKVEKFRKQAKVALLMSSRPSKSSSGGISDLEYMEGLSFEEIMHAELKGTQEALSKKGRISGTITIPKITPESLGALFMFYEIATAYMGAIMGINTFNQPGVEEGKKIAKKLLS